MVKNCKGKKPNRYAEGSLVNQGTYDNGFGVKYTENNPYTAGMTGEKLYSFLNNNTNGNLVNQVKEKLNPSKDWDFQKLKYLYHKTGIHFDAMPEDWDAKAKLNEVLKAKGSSPISNWNQLDSSLAPLIKKRNAKGVGGVLGMVAPIALSLLAPGLGTALGSALSIGATAGTALAGAGLGAIGSGISGGNPLKGALLGGVGGGIGGYMSGLNGSYVKALSGPMSGSYVTPSFSTALSGPSTGMALANYGPTALTKTAGTLDSSLLDLMNKLGVQSGKTLGASDLMKVAGKVGGALQGQQQQGNTNMGGSSLTPEQVQYLVALAQKAKQQGTYNVGTQLRRAKGGPIPLSPSPERALNQGRLIKGAGDGMSDSVPATIDNKAPAKLSSGEHVVPALQVAMLGRGDNEAGSKKVEDIVKREIAKLYGKGVNPVKMQSKAMTKPMRKK